MAADPNTVRNGGSRRYLDVSMSTLSWQTRSGKGVAVHAPEGSYPARRAAAELREAERAVGAIDELLAPAPGGREVPVDIYLTDAVVTDEQDADVLHRSEPTTRRSSGSSSPTRREN